MSRWGIRQAAVLATALVLSAGATACGEKDAAGGPAAGAADGRTDPSDVSTEERAAYRDRMVAHLRTTSQGAHVTGAEIFAQDGDLFMMVDTDLPAGSGPALDTLAAEAEEWAAAHREVDIEVLQVHEAGRGGDFAYGYVPDLDAEQGRRDAYAAALVAFLKTTPEGASVTGARTEVVFGDVELVILTDRAPVPPGTDGADPRAAETRAVVRALLASADGWVRQHREYAVTHVFVRDADKGGLDSAPVG
ncbi:hypothetical protein LO772_15030 [Yinghuangia sp. ASG 101]|uniref:hypothetical protein n=1 Tax=Yinghuangia sp. ASG 101 TaxID=2896848 RepID=UPI001E5AC0B6|nr:hypothetical protein [Yinghuangia sp. ASG 101]UGQ14768.1 hypothetical protein LO772_15030 [Yinghuangia sp. ASG 101]